MRIDFRVKLVSGRQVYSVKEGFTPPEEIAAAVTRSHPAIQAVSVVGGSGTIRRTSRKLLHPHRADGITLLLEPLA